jgi:hypothetical protein
MQFKEKPPGGGFQIHTLKLTAYFSLKLLDPTFGFWFERNIFVAADVCLGSRVDGALARTF